VPESRNRRRVAFTPPAKKGAAGGPGHSGRWVVPTMLTLLLVGLAWIVVYYLAGSDIPLMADLGGWNLLIGMGLISAGFAVSTQWR
jgi:hypothetical protein